MTEIVLVRHGETEWNVAQVFRGRIDVELNETGLKQAELLAEHLSQAKIEAIYSSPLKRALRTAETITRYQQLEVQAHPGLNDLDFGQWQGLSRQDVQNRFKESHDDWLNHPERVRMPGGESLEVVRQRALELVKVVISRHEGTVVLVSHRVVNKVLICALLELDNSHFWNISLDTCGLTTFLYQDERFILTEHNNTSFLKPLQKARLPDF
jgi:broad specificity phosphatase PhoE